MAALGKFFVEIGSKFDKKGLDKARAAISGVAVAGAAMGAALVAAGLKAAQMAGVQEKAEVALGQAMKTAGTFTEEALKHNLEYASSLQKITIFGDETILSVQKLLTNYGAQGEQLDELTKSTLDFATATGMSLEGAAALVGKTIGSTTNALTRYGIAVDGAVGSNERMISAVEGITRLFGGAAQAEAKTYAGRLQQLNNRWGDFIEKVGFQVIPVVTELITAINTQVLPGLENWIENLSSTGRGTELLVDRLKSLFTMIIGITSAADLLHLTLQRIYFSLTFNTEKFLENAELIKQKTLDYAGIFEAIKDFEVGKTQEAETTKTSIAKTGIDDRAAADAKAAADAAIDLKKRMADFRAFSDSLASAWAGSMATFILEGGRASIAIKNIWDDIRRFVVTMISQMIAKWITFQILTGGFGMGGGIAGKLLGFQSGVKNFKGGLAMVGEGGPELVNLPKGSDVISAPETSRIMNSRGGDTIINNDLSGAVFTEGRIEETLEQINKAVKDGVFEGNELTKTITRRASELSEEA